MKRASIKKNGATVFGRCEVTESAFERMRGLLGRRGLGEGEALWIRPCTSVHTFFMGFAIDVAFVDRQGRVVALYENLKPWRHSLVHLRAVSALEAAAGAFARAGIRKGEVLELCPTT